MKVYHYTNKNNIDNILSKGLLANSRYEEFTPIRANVVYCWLSQDDNKLFNNDAVCIEIDIEEDRCIIADMEWISLAMMYKYGGEKYGGKNIQVNENVSKYFVKIYEETAKTIANYINGEFFTPEVLITGDIIPQKIRMH